jgi:hypothetical protein
LVAGVGKVGGVAALTVNVCGIPLAFCAFALKENESSIKKKRNVIV